MPTWFLVIAYLPGGLLVVAVAGYVLDGRRLARLASGTWDETGADRLGAFPGPGRPDARRPLRRLGTRLVTGWASCCSWPQPSSCCPASSTGSAT